MPKKIFSYIFIIFTVFSVIFTPINASAYEVTEFEITAKAGMLISLDTDEILFEKNINKKVYPASITKIMTVTVILENEKFNPDKKIAMTKSALDLILGTGSVVSNLKEGEKISQLDLIYYILMSSAGDVAYLAAEYYEGSVDNFVAKMNSKAQELGLAGTHYQNPVGLHHEENYTTVQDICTLTKYALKNKIFEEVCTSPRYTVPATNMSGERTLTSTNYLMNTNTNYYYPYARGVKTGFTDEAGRCVVSTATYKKSTNETYSYLCIIMGCPNSPEKRYEFAESADLYRWAFKNFSFKEIANSSEPVCEIPVELSFETDFMPLHFKEPFVTVLPNEADDSTIVIKPELNSKSVEAPVKKGDVLGKAKVYYAERLIGTVDLVAGGDVKSSRLLVFVKYVKQVFSSVYMKLLIGVVVILILIFIILCIRMNMARIRKRKVRYVPYSKRERRKDENDY